MHPNSEQGCSQDTRAVKPSPLHVNVVSCSAQTIKKEARSVFFDQTVRVAIIPHVIDLTEGEVGLLWYTTEEYEQSRDTVMRIVRRMNKRVDAKDSRVKPVDVCTRGLEGLSKARGTTRRIRRLAALDAVLTEQSFQREEGQSNPEFLRQLYLQISAPCQADANLVALQDQKEAMECFMPPECSSRGCSPLAGRHAKTASRLVKSSSAGRIARTRN